MVLCHSTEVRQQPVTPQHGLSYLDSRQDAADIKKIPNRYQRLINITTVHYWMFGKGRNILWANYNTASVDAWLETQNLRGQLKFN